MKMLSKKTFATIPDNLALNLYEKYKNDFDIFGYEKSKWLPLRLSERKQQNYITLKRKKKEKI